MSERSRNSIFLTKIKQNELKAENQLQFASSLFPPQQNTRSKTVITKKSKTSTLKDEIVRPKSRLQVNRHDVPAESAFPTLKTSFAASKPKEENIERHNLPYFYSLGKDFVLDDDDQNDDNYSRNSVEEVSPLVFTSPSMYHDENKVDNEILDNEKEIEAIDKEIREISKAEISQLLALVEEEEDYENVNGNEGNYDIDMKEEEERNEERKPAIVMNEFKSVPMSRQDSYISSNDKDKQSGITSPSLSSIHVQFNEPSAFSLNLPLDEIENDVASSQETDELIPVRLLDIIDSDRTSISYLALTGSPVNGYSPKRLKEALKQLNGYLEKCIDMGYIWESSFVEDAVKLVKAAYDESLQIKDYSAVYEVEDHICSVETEMTQKQEFFTNQSVLMNAEKDLNLKELELKLDEDLDEIDRIWTSEEQTTKYNKVSFKLRNLRREAATLLAAKRFAEAEIVAQQADRLAEVESKQASDKMKDDYMKAIQKRREQFQIEKSAILSQHERKVVTLEKEKKRVDTVLKRRYDKLVTKKKNIEQKLSIKPGPKSELRSTSKFSTQSGIQGTQRRAAFTDVTKPSAGLSLKPLKKVRRTTTNL